MATFEERWTAALAAGVPRGVQLRFPAEYEDQPDREIPTIRRSLLESGSLTRKLFDKPSIGNAACSTLKFRMLPAKYSSYEFTRAQELTLQMQIYEEYKTLLTKTQNPFYVYTRKVNRKTGWEDFVCYDRMIYAEEIYRDDRQDVSYPMPAADVVSYIAGKLGLEVDPRNEIGDFPVDSPIEVYTMREVLRFIAAGSGGNFVISNQNTLWCVPFGSAEESAEEACSELDYAEPLTVTGVRLFPDGNTQYFSGDESGLVLEGECAYATQALCDAVAAKLIGKVYRAFEAQEVRLDPAAELGSSVRIDGRDYMIASISYRFTAAMAATVGAPWVEDVEPQIPFHDKQSRFQRETAQSFSEIRKSTEEIALEVQGKVGEDEVSSLISVGLNGIQLSAESGENKCTITLTGEGLDAKQVVAEFSKIIADEVSASNVKAGTMQADEINTAGTFNVGYGVDEDFEPTGYMGAGFGADANLEDTYGVILAASPSDKYGSGDCYVIVTNGGVRLQAGSNRVVVTPKNISITSEVGDVLINGNPVGQAVFG